MLDWNTYKSELLKAIPEFGKLQPDSLKGYLTLSNAHSKDSLLGEKTRQLISLAVAVTTRCDGCIVIHTEAALKAGATREEIAEALGGCHGHECRGSFCIFTAHDGCCKCPNGTKAIVHQWLLNV